MTPLMRAVQSFWCRIEESDADAQKTAERKVLAPQPENFVAMKIEIVQLCLSEYRLFHRSIKHRILILDTLTLKQIKVHYESR